ncbi:MFS transporter [Cupriavidus pinatubonensis]|uniref:MFS transporter n=1 Tax=Cupriavidus pinatubonensis TaxID=248026 RepID=UPI001128C516|nr:MFS transporter [Cupriavidus pinatubonensis]TPQ35306.1 MFS transporter [Cupriavidus pinatubonensis]
MTTISTSAARQRTADIHSSDEVRSVYAKVTRRIIPFLFICYVFAYLDRVNIGFAALQMKHDLGFSDAVYGLGAGIFFIGYFLFEVPSNLLLEKIGARKTMMRIMVVWGVISASFAFITSPTQFYVARFFLGAFEAGFFPGIVLYLTYWFPPAMRGKIITLFMSAIAVSGIIGGPLSGWIMTNLSDTSGLHGWQWLFIIEAVPSVILGVLVLFVLADKPADASWLSAREQEVVAREVGATDPHGHDHSFLKTLRDPRLYALSVVYFTIAAGLYIISFWLPEMVRSYHVTNPLHIGILTMIPYLITTVGMVVVGKHSDKTRERRWHVALGMIVAAMGLVAVTFVHSSLPVALAVLSITTLGVLTAMPLFWTIPTSYLSSSGAAGGIAVINSIGLIGGFASPSMLGLVKTTTGSLDYGLYTFAAALVLGAVLLLAAMPQHLLREEIGG